jgi:hypothetical protein
VLHLFFGVALLHHSLPLSDLIRKVLDPVAELTYLSRQLPHLKTEIRQLPSAILLLLLDAVDVDLFLFVHIVPFDAESLLADDVVQDRQFMLLQSLKQLDFADTATDLFLPVVEHFVVERHTFSCFFCFCNFKNLGQRLETFQISNVVLLNCRL